MKNWLLATGERFKICSCWVGAIVSWLIILGFFSIGIFVFSKPYISRIYEYNYTLIETDTNKSSEEELLAIQKLIQRNKIIPVSVVYEDTLKYYEDIIAILITLLGLFAVVSWFFLGGRMRESLHKELQSKWFDICVEDKLSKFLKNNVSDYLAEELDEEKIRSIAREEYETMRNKLSDEIQKSNQLALNVTPPARHAVRKKKGGK